MSNITSCVGPFLLKLTGSELYATGNSQFATLAPPTADHRDQLWEGFCVPGKEGVVTIKDKNSGEGWTFTTPGNPVTLSKTPSSWYIDFVSKDTVTVHAVPSRPMVGATWYAGVDKDQVVLTSVPVVPQAPKAPVWQFINQSGLDELD